MNYGDAHHPKSWLIELWLIELWLIELWLIKICLIEVGSAQVKFNNQIITNSIFPLPITYYPIPKSNLL